MKKYVISLFTFWYLANTMPVESEKALYEAIHSILQSSTFPVSGVCQLGDDKVSFVHHSFDRNPSKPILRGLTSAFKSEEKD
jgi:hypothetical protein